jgi:hypothetical protein
MKQARRRKVGPSLEGRSKAGKRFRRCALCHGRAWYVSRLLVACKLSHGGERIEIAADALVCDGCLDRNPAAKKHAVPLEVARAEEFAPRERVRKVQCHACGGGGCRRCDGRGSVEVGEPA